MLEEREVDHMVYVEMGGKMWKPAFSLCFRKICTIEE